MNNKWESVFALLEEVKSSFDYKSFLENAKKPELREAIDGEIVFVSLTPEGHYWLKNKEKY